MNGQNRKQQLARFIDEVSFALDDVVLFLDTHPCNQEALACYEEYKKNAKRSNGRIQPLCGTTAEGQCFCMR